MVPARPITGKPEQAKPSQRLLLGLSVLSKSDVQQMAGDRDELSS